MNRLTGARAVCAALESLGVAHVFADPGTEIAELLEGLRTSGLRTVVPTSELPAVFMALGYAQASGRVGVAAVIPGPGLAYALPGLAEARYDSVPLLVLTGVPDQREPFDLGDSVRPVVKGLLEPEGTDELADAVREGHALAAAGEPGPVVVRLPPAALAAAARDREVPERAPAPLPDVTAVAARLRDARRVTLLLGQGAADAAPEAVELAALAVESDVPAFLRALLAEVDAGGTGWEPAELERRRAELAQARTTASRTDPRLAETTDPDPAAFFAALRRALPPEGVLAVDSGLHQQLARRGFQVLRPRTFLLPCDFQSMGFALPAAVGAALAHPDRPVVALLGDGGLAISGLELLTASRAGVPLTVVVFNDGSLNLIRLQQLLHFGREHGVTQMPAVLAALAQSTGARYVHVTGDPEPVLVESIGAGEPRLLEVVLEDGAWLRRAGTIGSARRAVRTVRSRFGL